MKRAPGNDSVIETHPWALGLQRRNNLTIPRGTVFQAEQTQPVPKIAGTIDPPGVYEYVVVGYYGRETKYLVVEAEEHHEAYDQYTFIIFSEKEIKYWQEKNLKLATKTFDKCKRPLPGCDHAGFLIVTPWDPTTASVTDSSDVGSHNGDEEDVVKEVKDVGPSYEPWPQGLQKKYKLAIPRGTLFIHDQIHSKCQFQMSRLHFNVKTAGKGSESCRTGLHEYVVAGFDPREDKYYCYEAESDPLHSLLFPQATIEKAMEKIDELRSEPRISFDRNYPPMPVIDNNFKITKPGEEKQSRATKVNKTSLEINARITRLSSFDARCSSPMPSSPPGSRLPPGSILAYDQPVTPRMTMMNPSRTTTVDFDMVGDSTRSGRPNPRLSQSPIIRNGSISPMRTSPRNTYAPERSDSRNVTFDMPQKRQTAAAWLGTSSPEVKPKASPPLSVQSPTYGAQRRPSFTPMSPSSSQSHLNQSLSHINPSQTAPNFAQSAYHTPYRSQPGSPMSAMQLGQTPMSAMQLGQAPMSMQQTYTQPYSMQPQPPVRSSSYAGPGFGQNIQQHQLNMKQHYAEPPQGTNYPPPFPPNRSATSWLSPE